MSNIHLSSTVRAEHGEPIARKAAMHTIPEYPTDDQAREMHYRTPHPFFVYGTLRPNRGNTWAWDDMATPVLDGDCWVNDYRLVGSGFPYALPSEGSVSTGCLIVPHNFNDCYAKVRANMDSLEGFPNHYDRLEVDVHTAQGSLVAWMYVPTSMVTRIGMHEVPVNTMGRHDWSLAR